MSFFGLTGLGSQNVFDLAKETPLYVFEPSDWQAAFMETVHPGFTLHSESDDEVTAARHQLTVAAVAHDQLPVLLQHLYKCPKGVNNVPESARQLVADGFAAFEGQVISLPTFLAHVKRIRERAEDDEAKAQHYAYLKGGSQSREHVSGLEYRAALAKHTRLGKDPREKLVQPMTDAQTMGWDKPTILTERHPTTSCEETKYASAMVKAGVYYA